MGGDTTKIITVKERAYFFCLKLIKFIDSLNSRDMTTQIIMKQLLRSGTSIGANIVEAQAGSSKKDFANFIRTHSNQRMKQNFGLDYSEILINQIKKLRIIY